MTEPVQRPCAGPYCDRPAVAAVYIHGTRKPRPTILIRGDHLNMLDNAADFRCLDCLLGDIERAFGT